MIKVENIEVFNFEGAIRGLRNPMNSWSKSDSHWCGWEMMTESCDECRKLNGAYDDGVCLSDEEFYCIGDNDLNLMKRLFNAGTEHRKYLRQIFVSMDITAPVYWISELDTYKVGTVRNSCSFMHKGTAKSFEITDFSTHNDKVSKAWETVLDELNQLRKEYLDTKDNEIFEQIRCLLPSGYNLRFTLTMDYENVFAIIKQRTGHRLTEWNEFIEILKTLPYVKEIGDMNEKGGN